MNRTTDGATPMDSGSSGAEVIRAIATAFQAAFIGLGGAWALYVYLRTRRGQVRVETEELALTGSHSITKGMR